MATAVAKQQDVCPWCGQRIPHKQFVELAARIRAEEKRRLEAAEVSVQAKLAEEREALETRYKADRASLELMLEQLKEQLAKAREDQAEFDRRMKEAIEGAAQAERHKVEAEVTRKHVAEREHQREVLKADFDQRMLKQEVENQKAAAALRKQVGELQRKLEEQATRKPEVVDIDLFEQLRTAYPEDRLLRLPKGEAGGDLLLEVKYKDAVCGRIIIDSRCRGNWQTSYAARLCTDMADQKPTTRSCRRCTFRVAPRS